MYDTEVREARFKNDLYKIRTKMIDIQQRYVEIKQDEIKKMTARPKTYAGTAKEFADPEASKKITDHEIKANKLLEW